MSPLEINIPIPFFIAFCHCTVRHPHHLIEILITDHQRDLMQPSVLPKFANSTIPKFEDSPPLKQMFDFM